MSNIRFEAQAKKLAKETGLDKLGQSTLKKLDPDKDGIVRLKDAQKLVKAAGLSKDGVLGTDDRKRIREALGGAGNGTASTTKQTKGPSSAVSAKAQGTAKPRKLEDGYMQLVAKKVSGGLEAKLDFTRYNSNGDISGEASGKLLIDNLDPVSIEAHHYDAKGRSATTTATTTASGVISDTSTAAAGAVLLVADKKRGVVLVDIVGGDHVQGKQPPQRELLSLEKLAKDSTVKAAAKALGLSPTKLSVEVLWVDASNGFEDKLTNTLAFELKLKDGNGKSKKQEFSTYLLGSMKKGLAGLSIEKLERGVDNSWGWFYPPSAGVHDKPKTNTNKSKDDDLSWHSNTGGGETTHTPHTDNNHTHTGGSETTHVPHTHNHHSNNWTGGSE